MSDYDHIYDDIQTLAKAGNIDAISDLYFKDISYELKEAVAIIRSAYEYRTSIENYNRILYKYAIKYGNKPFLGMVNSRNKIWCVECFDTIATWWYAPYTTNKNNFNNHFYCDDHVPRGCSCNSSLKKGIVEKYDIEGMLLNTNDDYEYDKDSLGRDVPCIEYDYSEDGFDITEYLQDYN